MAPRIKRAAKPTPSRPSPAKPTPSTRAPSRASKRGATSPPPDTKPSKAGKRSAAATATSTRSSKREKSEPKTEPEADDPLDSLATDPWTDAEESLLFKSLIRWKPTGLHKHFRMLAIFENMRSNGFGTGATYKNAVDLPSHVRIPGIWAKLGKLYHLDALDERENANAGMADDEEDEEVAVEEQADEEEEGGEEGDEQEDPWAQKEFKLPEVEEDPRADYGAMMWERRFVKGRAHRSESPQVIPGLNQTRSLPGVTLSGTVSHEEDEEVEGGEGADEEEEEEDEKAEEEEAEEEQEEEAEEEEEEVKSSKTQSRNRPKKAAQPSSRRTGRRR